LVPYSTSGFEGPLAAGVTCPLRSVLRVWLPSRRLTPCESVPALFHTGGAHGIHPSEPSPLERYPVHFELEGPTYCWQPDIPHTRRCGAGAGCRSFWALTLPRVPGKRPVFSTPPAGCSLGFSPLRADHEDLRRDFAQRPLMRFSPTPHDAATALQSLVRSSLLLVLPWRQAARARVSHPYRLYAPVVS
jgi:hypothetical protein